MSHEQMKIHAGESVKTYEEIEEDALMSELAGENPEEQELRLVNPTRPTNERPGSVFVQGEANDKVTTGKNDAIPWNVPQNSKEAYSQ